MAAKAKGNDLAVMDLGGGIFCIPGQGGSCNAFVLKGREKIALIDVGLPDNIGNLEAGLKEIGVSFDDVNFAILTHEHADHIGCIPDLPRHIVVAAHTQAAIKIGLGDSFSMMSGAFSGKSRSFHVDVRLENSMAFALGNINLRVVHTPGHCSGAICLYETQKGLLFTGDTIFARGTLGGIFASGNISDYITSLYHLQEFRLTAMFPGHGAMSETPYADLDVALHGSKRLMAETMDLFGSLSTADEFHEIKRSTAEYSRRAAK